MTTKTDKTPVLSDEQIAEIQRTLDASIPEGSDICLTRETIYRGLRERAGLDMELYRFERALTTAIRIGRITGYETRRGRCGGICRKGAFSKSSKSKGKCELTINGKTYQLGMSEHDAEQFLMGILGAKPARQGEVLINNKIYSLPKAILLSNCLKPESEKLLANCLKALRAQGIENESI